MTRIYPVLAALMVVVLASCTESSNITVHEPGVYKGASDPLLTANADERAKTLRERFQSGQLDR